MTDEVGEASTYGATFGDAAETKKVASQNPFDHLPDPLLFGRLWPGRGKDFVSEGHPFGPAQGRLSDSSDTPRRVGAIESLYKSDRQSRVPYLSNIPILGTIFKNTETRDIRKELLIFVTPRIVVTPDVAS